jgi:hypothetical protein
MAAWLALGLGAILGVSAALGGADLGSAVALGFVLTAVPSLPTTLRSGLATIGIRGATVLVGAMLAVLAAGDPLALGVVTVAAAVCGGLLERVGPTAGLAVVLVGVDVERAGHGDASAWAVLLPYLAGVLVVGVAWAAWFMCAEAIRITRRQPGAEPAVSPSRSWRMRCSHAGRVGVAVTAAVALAALLPADLVGGHWLITSVLLTVQPAAVDTGMRLAQRLSGNAVGALIAAVLLGAHPAVPVVAVVTVVLFTLAMALRPVNYTWWAVTGPPVLLVISEYPQLFPWYEGGVRLVMNLLGAAIVLVVVFGFPALGRIRSRRSPDDFPTDEVSDSVYKIQIRRV